MRMKYLGDSYDIVKQSLLLWLQVFGKWSAHPMFTENVSDDDINAFGRLLDVEVVSREVLTVNTDRSAYFSVANSSKHLFLDPDTGLRMCPTRNGRAPKYLFARELVYLAAQRPKWLTLVFDQSVRRGSERLDMEKKIRVLCQSELYGFAYISHACFLVVGKDQALVKRARSKIIKASRLPESRFLEVMSVEQ